jgi:kinesin family protein 6/9
VNNTKALYKFQFNNILGQKASQDDAFVAIAQEPLLSALEGYNATVFAYGQTGSGKTFTITGGAERYVDRGIIPRALSMLFSEKAKRDDMTFQFNISYLEIYKNKGYDLLDPANDTTEMKDRPEVTMMEDDQGNCLIRNLGMHVADNEEDALNLLFLGDTNRQVNATVMNKESSRSHCIFTISIESRKAGSDVIMRSKFNLVDLAGSERVHKTNATGQIFQEAVSINAGLHYLEMVIVALHERATKGRQHIPYRNSMMTSMLRDSLGGNCKTVMVATISAEDSNTEESISTCKFAQRVAQIKNDANVNEELDPNLIIARLKGQIATLKEEVTFLKGGEDGGEESKEGGGGGETLSDEDRDNLRQRCATYVEDKDPMNVLSMGGTFSLAKARDCFAILKGMVLAAREGAFGGGGGGGGSSGGGSGGGDRATLEKVKSLSEQLKLRDHEVGVLVKMCNTLKQQINGGSGGGPGPGGGLPPPGGYRQGGGSSGLPPSRGSSSSSSGGGGGSKGAVQLAFDGFPDPDHLPQSMYLDPTILKNPKKCFETFREDYPKSEANEENKRVLKEKIDHAKGFAEKVNGARRNINLQKQRIEQARLQRAMAEVTELSLLKFSY